MTDEELRAELLSIASRWRERAENLVSDDWHESYAGLPTLRQNQIGMAWSLSCQADEIVSLLGMDPRSLWPEPVKLPPLPHEERKNLSWSDGTPA